MLTLPVQKWLSVGKTPIKLFLITIFFSSAVQSQNMYFPVNGELPPEGKYIRLGPMEIIMARLEVAVGDTFKVNEGPTKKYLGQYVGYLELGVDFVQFEIHEVGKGLLYKSFNISNGNKFIKSGTNKFYETSYYWSGNTAQIKKNVTIQGCKTSFFCQPIISFDYRIVDSNNKISEILYLSYMFAAKKS